MQLSQLIDLMKGGLGGAAVGPVLKAAHFLASDEIEHVMRTLRVTAVHKTPTNHDLERGLRIAQITAAAVVLVMQRKEEEEIQVEERGHRIDPFIDAGLAFLRHQAGLNFELKTIPNDALVKLLETGLNSALAEAGRGEESPATKAHRENAQAEVWAELVNGVPDISPRGELQERFLGQRSDEPGWFACFIAFFRETLKENPKVWVPFVIGRIAEVLQQGNATRELLLQFRSENSTNFAMVQSEAERRHAEVMAGQKAMMEAIARDKGVPIAPLAAVLRLLGEADVPPEIIPTRLEAAAGRLLELEARLSQSSNDRPETAAARERARRLLDAGDLDGAEAALRDARSTLRERREQTAREEAALLRDEAGIAQLRLDYRAEAALRCEAATLLDFDDVVICRSWLDAAGAMYRDGYEFGDPASLREAVRTVEDKALSRALRSVRPIDWAMAQHSLGVMLRTLGDRGEDDTALAKAVVAFENALLEYTRERAPLEWAITQNNLGITLQALGKRGDNTALTKAVTAFENALLELTRERAPIDWAMAQNNIGVSLLIQGERREDADISRAVMIFEDILLVRTQEIAPTYWASTQMNLGIAFQMLGHRGDDIALAKAVTAFENALLELTRERAPLDWAQVQNNLGNTLQILGLRGDDAALTKAVTAFENALLERTRERVPRYWAMTQNNLGNTLRILGQRGDDAAFSKAVIALESALLEFTRERDPFNWSLAQNNLALAEMMIGDRDGCESMWQSALVRLEAALEEFRPRSAHNTQEAERLATHLRAKLNLVG